MRRSRKYIDGNERLNISNNLRRIRNERGYSQRMLAELSGVSESSIYWWERGTHRPHLVNLEAVAETLKVNVETLKGE